MTIELLQQALPVLPAFDADLKTIATKMSNVFFNLAQHEGDELSAQACQQMKRLYTDWDAAVRKDALAVQPAKIVGA